MSTEEIKVTFQPSGRTVYVLRGTVLIEAAGDAGIILRSPCGGKGTCGGCRVELPHGATPPTDTDVLRLSAEAAEVLRGILDELVESGKDSSDYLDAIRDLAVEVPIGVVEVGDLPWIGIDIEEDLIRARQQILPQIERLDRGDSLAAA